MYKTFYCSLLLTLLLSSWFAEAALAAPIAMLSQVQGAIRYRSASSYGWVTLASGSTTQLFSGDAVEVEGSGQATLTCLTNRNVIVLTGRGRLVSVSSFC